MVHAFTMVKAVAGQAETVRDAVAGLEEVTEAHVVAGEYDVIAEVDAEEVGDVLHAVSSAIHAIDGVGDTKTYISMSV